MHVMLFHTMAVVVNAICSTITSAIPNIMERFDSRVVCPVAVVLGRFTFCDSRREKRATVDTVETVETVDTFGATGKAPYHRGLGAARVPLH